MHISTVLSILTLSLSIFGAPVDKRSLSSSSIPKFHTLDFDIVDVTPSSSKREKTETIYRRTLYYFARVTIGSTKQQIGVTVDTGSADLWFPSNDATCTGGNDCKSLGTFTPAISNTFHNLSTPVNNNYGDGDGASGYWGKDDYWFTDGTKVEQIQFGLMNSVGRETGVLGLGLPDLEATNEKYPNFPAALKNAGIIDKTAYSLYLNSATASSGSVVFGAIDKAKYTGDLAVLDFADYTWTAIKLDSVTAPDGTKIDLNIPVALDSGTTYIQLDTAVAKQIYQTLGLSESGSASCDQLSLDNNQLTLNFAGVSITIPYKSLFYQFGGGSLCQARIYGSNDGNNFFGDLFLQNAYVAFNLDSKKVGLAKANYNDATDLVDFWF
ncbi:Eukaryotic aspartyl protease family protein [Candida parapsilosis]|uniref:candidapepsin n=2 Tax=Candida parapsilosis TaxID=5480 RepID=G8BKB2_CANPC|nr:uncharacterized protein CPAR2_701890 [Candida parapsilosis]KAF6042249.1 Eukaryotic aspartyl protease family protein [Candida parapsilosis]KAF6042528.1 Eukaryotic aspartyl protease family protein [Candida parapsilosis]KAF6042973.1 Eukaryotic aspartyl protease family protein [Candida parapsilosis]KAF6058018.1 Eukaryotic aspartyl protease family protein [Candida parapsilosis]KAI5901114.1 Candidapepsin-5 [Candida parapsilosis]